ncbi:MAG: tRNA (adenosine(37)-N6)-threonylcarbamoyltransferase complex dimerization subunit type 1 TsaB [Chitinophagales bacterium]|nr:tRNA (adenosine(37)-N6)-threonylcarbamoyltransferase complex dimerization subunit type 1 TsaB [Chitinophagales bacterium]
MNYILYIETSTRDCSVALANGAELVVQVVEEDTRSRAKILQTLINKVMQKAGINYKDLKAVGVAAGPGSYTGLRIGMSAAKGLSFALDIPLMSFDTLESLAYTALSNVENPNAVCVASMPSRKGEIYYAVVDKKNGVLINSKPETNENFRIDIDQKMKIYKNSEAIVNQDIKLKADLKVPFYSAGLSELEIKNYKFAKNIIFLPRYIEAKNYIYWGNEKFKLKEFQNLISLEPKYMKPFISKNCLT